MKCLSIQGLKKGYLNARRVQNTKELIILDYPRVEIEINGKKEAIDINTFKIGSDVKFKEKVYLYSIMLTSQIYDVNNWSNPVKDGICISPIMVDPEDFSYRRKIVITFCPETNYQDDKIVESEFKDMLIENFKKALDSPSEYTRKGKRGILMRVLYPESVECENEKQQFENSPEGQYVII